MRRQSHRITCMSIIVTLRQRPIKYNSKWSEKTSDTRKLPWSRQFAVIFFDISNPHVFKILGPLLVARVFPLILWSCSRAIQRWDTCLRSVRVIRDLLGLLLRPSCSGSRLTWLRDVWRQVGIGMEERRGCVPWCRDGDSLSKEKKTTSMKGIGMAV